MKLFALVLVFVCGLAVADDAAVKKFRNYTPDQIKGLPKKTLDSELPLMYSMAAQKGLSKGAEIVFAMELNALMYPGIGDYNAAVKAFQKDLGDPVTGILTVSQIHSLERRADKQRLSTIAFPENFWSNKSDQTALVRGTLTLLDETIAWPINHIELNCYRKDAYCEFNQLSLATPTDSSFSQLFQVMRSQEIFQITRWGSDSIDAVSNSDDQCRSMSLNLQFKNKEFFYTTRNGSGNCSFMGQSTPKLPKPRIAQIVDGKPIIRKEFDRLRASAFEVMSSDFRKKIETLVSEDGKR